MASVRKIILVPLTLRGDAKLHCVRQAERFVELGFEIRHQQPTKRL
jgi:hypothetical protein